MIYRNKLGTFTFDDLTQESHMKLIVQNITGQYLNPKKDEPALTDEESCYAFIRDQCGNVLARVGFELEINEDVRVKEIVFLTAKQQVQALIDAYDARLADALRQSREAGRKAFAGWLVGPAALR